jgi:hypothetical protein
MIEVLNKIDLDPEDAGYLQALHKTMTGVPALLTGEGLDQLLNDVTLAI